VQSSHWNTSKWCFAEFTQTRALGKPIFQLVGVPGTSEGDDPANLAPISRDCNSLISATTARPPLKLWPEN
jgi:hypothetical protein